MDLTLEETNKRHKELWQGVIDYINTPDILDIPTFLSSLKAIVLSAQGYDICVQPTCECWLCEYYNNSPDCNCDGCPLTDGVNCAKPQSLWDKTSVAYEELFFVCKELKHRQKYKQETYELCKSKFIKLAEQIRDIVD